MTRVRLVSVIIGLAVVLAGPAAAIGAPSANASGHTIRFDNFQIVVLGAAGGAPGGRFHPV